MWSAFTLEKEFGRESLQNQYRQSVVLCFCLRPRLQRLDEHLEDTDLPCVEYQVEDLIVVVADRTHHHTQVVEGDPIEERHQRRRLLWCQWERDDGPFDFGRGA